MKNFGFSGFGKYGIVLSCFFLNLLGTSVSVADSESPSRLSDRVVTNEEQLDKFTHSPKPILELGEPLLGTGKIDEGFEIPTGAIWQPSLIVFGTYRTAYQYYYDGNDSTSEWANRFDLFGNLYLTQTERILAGIRFLDQNGRFTGYTFKSPDPEREGTNEEYNADITTLFFEGDFRELFPFLDPKDKYGLDYGISVGRQPISFQQGILINDSIDAIGISKINIRVGNVVNYRTSVLYSNNEINRTNLANDDESSRIYGWFNEIDWQSSTVEFDAIYVDADDDVGRGTYLGAGASQRIGRLNTAFRVVGSIPDGDETEHNRAGVLFVNEISWTPLKTHNHCYLNSFVGIEDFRSASRGPSMQGPLSPVGILFESVGLGTYSSPLSNVAQESIGGALGYQMFFAGNRRQLIVELGGRYADEIGQRAVGLGSSFKMAVGQRNVIRFDLYGVYDEDREASIQNEDDYNLGTRVEWLLKL